MDRPWSMLDLGEEVHDAAVAKTSEQRADEAIFKQDG